MTIPIILFGVGATRGKFARVRYLSRLAVPCQRASSIRPTAYASLGYVGLRPRFGYAPFGVGATRGKFARSRRSDLDAPFALKTRSFFWPTPPRQDLWLRTKVSPTAPSLPLLTRENPPLRAFHCQAYAKNTKSQSLVTSS